MPSVTGPDGRKLSFPEGTDQQAVLRVLQQQYPDADWGGQQKPDFSNVSGGVSKTAPVAKPQNMLQDAGRGLGLGARAMLQGGADLIGIASDPFAVGADKLINALNPQERNLSSLITGKAPQPRRYFGTAREGATALADKLGLPTPQSAGERVSGGVTSALTGGGGMIGAGRVLAMRAPGAMQAAGEFLSSQPGTQLASLVGGSGASNVTREAGGSERAQGIAGLLGGLGIPAARAGGAMAVRGLARGAQSAMPSAENGFRGVGMGGRAADFRSLGVEPSVGQAAGNARTQGLESLLSGAPTSAGRMGTFAERQAADIGSGLQKKADSFLRNASAERAGKAVEIGADTFAGNVKATRKALYWQADRLIPPTTELPLSRTWQTLDELVSPVQGANATTGALVNPKIASMAQNVADDLAANGGKMPYEAVRALRSRIGEELTDFTLSADKPTAQYKRLYASLSQDLEEAARKQGPAAEQAYKRANSYTRASSNRLEMVQRVVDKNGGSEKVFGAVMAGTQDGGTTLRAVMQSLPKDGQKAVTAAVIKRMGLATAGNQGAAGEVFSAQTFLTNWNKVSPEAKRALFDRHGPQFSGEMDKIARVAERIRTGSKVFANPSGTANRAAAIGYYGSLPLAGAGAVMGSPLPLVGLVIGGISSHLGARAMTNPKIVTWLAKATELPASSLPQQLVILKQIAKTDTDAAEMVAELESQQKGSDAINQ